MTDNELMTCGEMVDAAFSDDSKFFRRCDCNDLVSLVRYSRHHKALMWFGEKHSPIKFAPNIRNLASKWCEAEWPKHDPNEIGEAE